MKWQVARQGAACAPPWGPSDFGQPQQSHFNKLPDLRELLNHAEEAKACQWAPKQSVAPTQLPFASVRDLDHQHQQHHIQTLAKHQPSPLGGEQWKRAKTPPQLDPYNAPDVRHGREEHNEGRDCGRSRTRGDRQSELDQAHSKSQKRSKSRWQSKSRKRIKSRRSKSRKHDRAESKTGTNLVGHKHQFSLRTLGGPKAGRHLDTHGHVTTTPLLASQGEAGSGEGVQGTSIHIRAATDRKQSQIPAPPWLGRVCWLKWHRYQEYGVFLGALQEHHAVAQVHACLVGGNEEEGRSKHYGRLTLVWGQQRITDKGQHAPSVLRVA